MNIQIVQIPYDSGHKSMRAGRGPEHFLQHGVDRILRECGRQVDVSRIESRASIPTEIGTMVELNHLSAEQVRSAVSDRRFPLVLAGNCNTCIGTISGLEKERLGIVWFDAHGDFNTPETTLSGFLDGMGLAMATGRCWQPLLKTIPGYNPVPEANVLLIGARALDAEEERQLRVSKVEVIPPGRDESAFLDDIDTALDRMRVKVSRFYVHVDMDAFDTGEAEPNRLAVPGGLSLEAFERIIARIKENFEISAAAITGFEPDYDKDDIVLSASIRVIKALVSQC